MATEREKAISEERLFEAAIDSAKQENYLGSRETVDALIRVAVSDMLDGVQKADGSGSRIKAMDQVAKRTAATLLGQNKHFAPMRKWNEAGGIDVFCAKWLGSAETDSKKRMEHSIIILFNEILELCEFAGTPGVLDEQWKGSFDAIIEKYVGIFTGVDLPTQALMRFEK